MANTDYLKLHEEDKKGLVLWYRTGRYTQRQLAVIFGTSRSVVWDSLRKYGHWSNNRLVGVSTR